MRLSREPPNLLVPAPQPLAQPFHHPRGDARRATRLWAPRPPGLAACTAVTSSSPCTHSPAPKPTKLYDMTTLGNLCVDVLVEVPRLPDPASHPALLDRLRATSPSPEALEVGGSGNVSIAAARMGLQVCCTGPLGRDAYGQFMASVLAVSRGLVEGRVGCLLPEHSRAGRVVPAECQGTCMVACCDARHEAGMGARPCLRPEPFPHLASILAGKQDRT